MQYAEVTKIIDDTFIEIKKTFASKGIEYANDEDALKNFKSIGTSLDIDAMIPLVTYMTKHWCSINNYVSCEVNPDKSYTSSEAIGGRIDDLILYAILLKSMIKERSNVDSIE